MERRPELTIIAGPNGAGKSRLCPFYVSAKSFDGDKLMLDLRREHPDWPDRWISGTLMAIVTMVISWLSILTRARRTRLLTILHFGSVSSLSNCFQNYNLRIDSK